MFPTKFRFNWLGSYREEDFLEIDQSETRIFREEFFFRNQKQEWPVVAMFVSESGENEQTL
jgi:hypothetical protein